MAKPLSAAEVTEFQTQLQHLHGALSHEVDEILHREGPHHEKPVGSQGDEGVDTSAQQLDYTYLENDDARLEEVADALERIREGAFGRCAGCGKWIPRERLRAVPYARRCVPCETSR